LSFSVLVYLAVIANFRQAYLLQAKLNYLKKREKAKHLFLPWYQRRFIEDDLATCRTQIYFR